MRSQLLEPRHKFRCEFLLYILVTLHTPGVVVFPAQQHLYDAVLWPLSTEIAM